MVGTWWRPLSEEGRLSQGDVLLDMTVGTLVHPRTPVARFQARDGAQGWKEQAWKEDKQGFCHCLGRGRITAVIVLTHSCQLDKDERARRVIIAPVSLTGKVDEKTRDNIFAHKRIPLVPLPDVPDLGDSYADLRLVQAVDRKWVDDTKRIATMTEEAVTYLQQRLTAFFARPGEEGVRAPNATP
jgi:hypothetical protein